jgi:hypothetical protein
MKQPGFLKNIVVKGAFIFIMRRGKMIDKLFNKYLNEK